MLKVSIEPKLIDDTTSKVTARCEAVANPAIESFKWYIGSDLQPKQSSNTFVLHGYYIIFLLLRNPKKIHFTYLIIRSVPQQRQNWLRNKRCRVMIGSDGLFHNLFPVPPCNFNRCFPTITSVHSHLLQFKTDVETQMYYLWANVNLVLRCQRRDPQRQRSQMRGVQYIWRIVR